MKNLFKRYKTAILMIIVLVMMTFIVPTKGQVATSMTIKNIIEMIKIIPPIFILLGLLDVWVPREQMIKYMGDGSGILGVIIAFLLGSVAAGPLYAAFPVAGVLLKKGAKFSNILIFIGAWSTTKIPLLLMEGQSLGWKFTITRLIINIFGIILIARITDKALNDSEKEEIYNLSENI
ncbi:MAG: permease [Clostridium sp.]